jgi:hypothetical protein
MAFENDNVLSVQDARQQNQGFLAQIRSGPDGMAKMANTINEEIILTILREDGIARRIMPFKPISSAELSTDLNNPDIPVVFVPVEPQLNEYLAFAVDFMQPSKDLWFRSKVAPVYFKPIKTKTIRLHEGQLLANNFPIRSYIESIAKNDILAVEDIFLVGAIERCVAKFAATNALVGTIPLTKEDIADANKAMIRNRLATVMIVLNEITYQDILKWNNSEVGSMIMEDLIEQGPKGEELKYKSWFGFKWVLTNNIDVVAENVLYLLPAQRYLGISYMLADAEQWLEFRDGILSTNTREIVGRNLFNPRGPIKMTLA